SKQAPAHFLQIWIVPERRGLPPSYEQRSFGEDEREARLRLVVDPQGRDGALRINADARLYAGLPGVGDRTEHVVGEGRHAWIQVARGRVEVDGELLEAGDGAAVSEPGTLRLEGIEAAEILVFDLA